MHIGIVGLGHMGANMARRLVAGGVTVVGYDPDASARAALVEVVGCVGVDTLEMMHNSFAGHRVEASAP